MHKGVNTKPPFMQSTFIHEAAHGQHGHGLHAAFVCKACSMVNTAMKHLGRSSAKAAWVAYLGLASQDTCRSAKPKQRNNTLVAPPRHHTARNPSSAATTVRRAHTQSGETICKHAVLCQMEWACRPIPPATQPPPQVKRYACGRACLLAREVSFQTCMSARNTGPSPCKELGHKEPRKPQTQRPSSPSRASEPPVPVHIYGFTPVPHTCQHRAGQRGSPVHWVHTCPPILASHLFGA